MLNVFSSDLLTNLLLGICGSGIVVEYDLGFTRNMPDIADNIRWTVIDSGFPAIARHKIDHFEFVPAFGKGRHKDVCSTQILLVDFIIGGNPDVEFSAFFWIEYGSKDGGGIKIR